VRQAHHLGRNRHLFSVENRLKLRAKTTTATKDMGMASKKPKNRPADRK
jgi:hypothetical protein